MSTYSRTTAFSNLFSKKSYCIPSFFNSKGVLHGTKPIASPILTTKRTTTILCVRKNGIVVMAGDGQVSQGSSVVKGNARKVDYLEEMPVFRFIRLIQIKVWLSLC